MSLKNCLEQIEHLERFLGRKSHSRKWMKRMRNKWLRKQKEPNTRYRRGWEY